MAKTMKAAVVREFGKPLTIDEVPVPEPGPGMIQVAIRASGINNWQLLSKNEKISRTKVYSKMTSKFRNLYE